MLGGVMNQQQPFSHGLLYSISPKDLSSLHLQDDVREYGFNWEEFKTRSSSNLISRVILSFLKKTAANLGITKP